MLSSFAMSRSVLAYSSHSCLGYSASSAVENCCVSVSKPHPKCSCEPSHCRQKHKKAALFVRKLVDLYLAPPYAHEWKVVKYEALTSCCMHGSSHSQLFVGFSMVHGTCIELRKKQKSHMCMYNALASSTRNLSLADILGTP